MRGFVYRTKGTVLWVEEDKGRAKIEIGWNNRDKRGATRFYKKLSDLELVNDSTDDSPTAD